MNNRENANNKNKTNNMNEDALNALLSVASKQLGVSPENLKNQLESGNVDKALKNVSPKQSQMLKKALSDKETAEKILSSPQAKALFKKLNGGK